MALYSRILLSMPKSKRAKVVHIGGAKSVKSREWKEGIVSRCQQYIDQFEHVYVFKNQKLRSSQARIIRDSLKPDTRIQMGPVKVMRVALGRSQEEEYQDGLHNLAERMRGTVGLLYSNLEHHELSQKIDKLQFENIARVGNKASWDFKIPKGPVYGIDGELLSHTQEPFLRKYGVPTKLNKGVVECLADHVVCTEGQKLDHKQVAVLGIFQQKMAISKLVLMARWDKQTCEYTSLVADEDLEDDDMNQSQFGDEFQIDEMEAMEEGMKGLPEGMMLPAELQ
eukprot:TRINITY_DN1700_c0_g1_i1.p2 TRINITY_DN1700_c0_g1~~TRINITY_DN1700_c0_g1_i1.p2  ORF type:complete len:282 (-),score=36.08 TRINITY_DN1700_c0_g1_i1:337-1182(-)